MGNSTNRTNPELLTKLILLVFRANGHLLEAGDLLVANYGLTSSRWQVLGCLYSEAKTVSQIARTMGLTRQSVQRTADTLHEQKFISLADNPNHARAPLLSLTTTGRAALKKATEAQKDWSKNLAKAQSSDELNAAIGVLEKLIHSIELNSGEEKA